MKAKVAIAVGVLSTVALCAIVFDQIVLERRLLPRENITVTEASEEAGHFTGSLRQAAIDEHNAPTDKLFEEYGIRSFTAFERNHALVVRLKELDPSFRAEQMGVSMLNSVAEINGRKLLLLKGCAPHNCAATMNIVAFEPSTTAVFLLKSNGSLLQFFGSPDSSVRPAMLSAAF
ncbi:MULTISPECIES: inhibitor of vertebrate lysozyme family protein [unclassified Bradyrhizobium]|uniref:inhibitor of vertebrate lysozyme family protein n=1 Tax=unclassified Bradyrhizobium TaxID=2631580 RepID=UPI001FFA7190|nr:MULTISPECIES: inhibitor of vertebrate lysozyme family protein [unclassified Bradyrhizobium]MCK1709733.1 hypothetical protein [Bradyrhizobium sp. 143]MCK1727574.1 hypothetical protein [Bradyrhizobium sp. 142]